MPNIEPDNQRAPQPLEPTAGPPSPDATIEAEPIVFSGIEQDAIDACRRVKRDLLKGEERLRRTIEAGRRLQAVERHPGARTDLIKQLDEVPL